MAEVSNSTRRFIASMLERPANIGALGGLAAAVVVALRIAVVGEDDPGRLVLLGSDYTSPGHRFAVPVHPGTGYDGEFYYRFALGPLHFAPTWSGITLDSVARYNRIAYSVLAWLVAGGGRASLVPWSLLLVNVVGIGVLAWLGAELAFTSGNHAAWGLLLPAFGGFLWSLGRDLTEITEAVFLVAALVALRRRHPGWAGAFLAAAVMSRETALGVVVAMVAVDIAGRVPSLAAYLRRHGRLVDDRPFSLTGTWLTPLLVFGGWQLAVRSETGTFPIFASGQHNLGLPLTGFISAFRHYVVLIPGKASLSWFGELFVLVVVVLLAARTMRASSAPDYERLGWVLYLVMAVCLSRGIWHGDVGFRSIDDLYVLSVVLIVTSARLTSDRYVRLLPILSASAWLLVAAQVVKDL